MDLGKPVFPDHGFDLTPVYLVAVADDLLPGFAFRQAPTPRGVKRRPLINLDSHP